MAWDLSEQGKDVLDFLIFKAQWMLPCTCGKEVWDFQCSKVIEYYGLAGSGGKRGNVVPYQWEVVVAAVTSS